MKPKYREICEKYELHKKAIEYIIFDGVPQANVIEINVDKQDNQRFILTLNGNNKLIYTSRGIQAEQCFKKYILWINCNCMEEEKLYCKKGIQYTDYAFEEELTNKESSCKMEQKTYLYKLGCMLAILNSIGKKNGSIAGNTAVWG